MEQLIVGSTDLTEFVKSERDESLEQKLNKKLNSLRSQRDKKGTLDHERGMLQREINQCKVDIINAQYALLSADFLDLKREITLEGRTIEVPAFGVFTTDFSLRDYDKFGIYIVCEKDEPIEPSWFSKIFGAKPYREYSYGIDIYSGIKSQTGLRDSRNALPSLFLAPAARIMGFKSESKIYGEAFASLSEEKRELYDHFTGKYRGPYSINTRLNCFIPDSTKERIKEAREQFKKQVYIIAEIKEDEWTIREMKQSEIRNADPLVVGVHDKKLYLVDRFDPTPLEELIGKSSGYMSN